MELNGSIDDEADALPHEAGKDTVGVTLELEPSVRNSGGSGGGGGGAHANGTPLK